MFDSLQRFEFECKLEYMAYFKPSAYTGDVTGKQRERLKLFRGQRSIVKNTGEMPADRIKSEGARDVLNNDWASVDPEGLRSTMKSG